MFAQRRFNQITKLAFANAILLRENLIIEGKGGGQGSCNIVRIGLIEKDPEMIPFLTRKFGQMGDIEALFDFS